MTTKKITILGSTGSIGKNTLDVIHQHLNLFEVIALTANNSVDNFVAQCQQWQPRYAVMVDANAAEQCQQRLKTLAPQTEVLSGSEALTQVASLPEVDIVMAAIVGGAGLLPTLAAAKSGKRVLLANKEALVMSGQLFMEAIVQNGAELLPIDSEHNAIFQCMPYTAFQGAGVQALQNTALNSIGVNRILLTASGGPFWNTPLEQLENITPDQACAHPNWKMGRKISVDSATMMNKGLEIIEACWLFATTPDNIEVVLHPQSIIHSLVEYADGSVLAQLGNPDMRTPIAHALTFPERITSGVARLNLIEIAKLEFFEADFSRFPCLRLAYEVMKVGGTATTVLNAANEVAVQAFLEERLPFTQISKIIETALAQTTIVEAKQLDVILQADSDSRILASEIIQKCT